MRGICETERFLKTLDVRRFIKAMVGLHAMSAVGPTSLAATVDIARQHGVGIHLHLGEAVHDNDLSVGHLAIVRWPAWNKQEVRIRNSHCSLMPSM